MIFCSSKQEAHELSLKLNQHGKACRALTGDDNIETRNEVVSQLEKGQLDYILTVDIFNEGIDIPSVNQVVMLRNTQPSIVFCSTTGTLVFVNMIAKNMLRSLILLEIIKIIT